MLIGKSAKLEKMKIHLSELNICPFQNQVLNSPLKVILMDSY